MKLSMLRESPLPILLLLASLYGFIEYLHWSVVRQEDQVQVVEVPAAFSLASTPAADGQGEPSSPGAEALPMVTLSPAAGQLHAEARALAAGGEISKALERLNASLISEGQRDAARLEERGALLLRLGRAEAAVADLSEAETRGAVSAVHFYNLGLARSRSGDEAGAETDYRRAVTQNPHFAEAWTSLARLLQARGDRDAAVDALRRAVDFAAGAARVQAMLALADLESDTPEGRELARALYQQIVEAAPGDPSGHLGLGVLENRAGRTTEAEKNYRAALEVQAGCRKARYNLAMLLLENGRAAEAMRHLEILAHDASDPRAWFGLGRARRALRDEAGAETAYREAIRLSDGKYLEAHFNLGLMYHTSGRDRESEAAYREALRQNPSYVAAWINLALLLEDLRRLPEALQAAERAVAVDARNEKAWFLKGRMLSEAGRPREALAAYQEAMRLRPGYTKAMLNAAVIHADAGELDEAIALYRQVLAVDPRNAAAWHNLGLALSRKGRADEARSAYEQAISADPEAANAAQNLGVLYARQGRTEDARRIFAEALERSPDNVGLRFNLALQLEKLGQVEAAVRDLERVVRLDPRHARAWTVLARLEEARGRTDQAQHARARAAEAEARRTSRPGGPR